MQEPRVRISNPNKWFTLLLADTPRRLELFESFDTFVLAFSARFCEANLIARITNEIEQIRQVGVSALPTLKSFNLLQLISIGTIPL